MHLTSRKQSSNSTTAPFHQQRGTHHIRAMSMSPASLAALSVTQALAGWHQAAQALVRRIIQVHRQLVLGLQVVVGEHIQVRL